MVYMRYSLAYLIACLENCCELDLAFEVESVSKFCGNERRIRTLVHEDGGSLVDILEDLVDYRQKAGISEIILIKTCHRTRLDRHHLGMSRSM